MSRTTVDIEAPILLELKRLQKKEGKSLGRMISELLAEALSLRRTRRAEPAKLKWVARPMRAMVDLDDKDAVWRRLDEKAR